MPEVQCTKFCTLQFITYPDVMYKVATAAILIQTRGVQRVFILENIMNEKTRGHCLRYVSRWKYSDIWTQWAWKVSVKQTEHCCPKPLKKMYETCLFKAWIYKNLTVSDYQSTVVLRHESFSSSSYGSPCSPKVDIYEGFSLHRYEDAIYPPIYHLEIVVGQSEL